MRKLLPSRHGAFLDDVTVIVEADYMHRILEGLVLTSLVVMDERLLHIGQDLLNTGNMLDEHALDTLRQGKRG